MEETCYSGLVLKLPNLKPEKPQKSSGGFLSVLGLGSSANVEAGGDKTIPAQPDLEHLAMGSERRLWGRLISFKGRMSMAAVFNESISEAFVRCLVQGGRYLLSFHCCTSECI